MLIEFEGIDSDRTYEAPLSQEDLDEILSEHYPNEIHRQLRSGLCGDKTMEDLCEIYAQGFTKGYNRSVRLGIQPGPKLDADEVKSLLTGWYELKEKEMDARLEAQCKELEKWESEVHMVGNGESDIGRDAEGKTSFIKGENCMFVIEGNANDLCGQLRPGFVLDGSEYSCGSPGGVLAALEGSDRNSE